MLVLAAIGISLFVIQSGVQPFGANPTQAVEKAANDFSKVKSGRVNAELLATIKLTYPDGTAVSKESTSKILLSSDFNLQENEVKARITQVKGEESTEYQYIYLKSGDMYVKMPNLTKWLGGNVPKTKNKTVLPTTLQTFDYVTLSLASLPSIKANTAEKKGTEIIDGNDTIIYSADIDSEKLASKLTDFEMNQDIVDSYKQSIVKTDLWIDKSGTIRRQLLTATDYPIVVNLNTEDGESAGKVKGKVNMNLTVNYSNLNQQLSISKPSGEIMPIEELLGPRSQ